MSDELRRRARVRPEHARGYPVGFQGQWFPVLDRHDPDVSATAGDLFVETAAGPQRVEAAHFDVVQRSKRQILVVDDDPGICKALQIALGKAGYDVLQAGDGAEGARLYEEMGPDLVITDIHMPKKSGLLLIEDIRAHGSATPVIAMTDGGPTSRFELLQLAQLLGAVRNIAKPFTLEEMVKAVDQELELT
jgi:CheY-like chemotaxis protein